MRAKEIGRQALDKFPESHHSYPSSMDKNRERGDIVLYRAGYIIRAAVEEALR